ncbi:unnamed protein product [Ilex paraguariensis]|uniref:Uncharacterized protein n=1 Tax=Ilex paraguariensis TaxID=185542 RepID=A0ABC8RV55_9AQUA
MIENLELWIELLDTQVSCSRHPYFSCNVNYDDHVFHKCSTNHDWFGTTPSIEGGKGSANLHSSDGGELGGDAKHGNTVADARHVGDGAIRIVGNFRCIGVGNARRATNNTKQGRSRGSALSRDWAGESVGTGSDAGTSAGGVLGNNSRMLGPN